MGRADVYTQPEADDPVLDDDLVLALARRHAPHARSVAEVDESGGEARAYLIDDDLVVKTQRPHRLRPRTSLAKEAYLLERLAPVLGGRIPRLLGYDRTDAVEYICMTRMPGRAVRVTALAPADRPAVLRELGAVLRALHDTEVEPDRLPTDTDAEALRRRLVFGFGDLADGFAEHPARAAALPAPLPEVTERAIAALPDALAPVVLHSNPSPTHVFVDPASGRFTGVIDFGDAYASHPALDLHRWADPADRVRLRGAYLDGGAPSPEFDRMWTVAMIYTDLAVVAAGSPLAADAAADLAGRLGDL